MTNKLTAEAPPKQPTAFDIKLLAFAQSAELSVHDLYEKAIDSEMFDGDELAMLQMFSDHHKAYAQSLNGLLGKSATNARNEALFFTHSSTVSSALATESLQKLENALVATHTEILSNLEGLDGAMLIASMITVEARQAAVFGVLPKLNLDNALNSAASSLMPSVTVAP